MDNKSSADQAGPAEQVTANSGAQTQPAQTPQPPAPELAEPTTQEAQYSDDDYEEQAGGEQGEPITWTASEFIAHSKTPAWYLGLAGVAIVLAVLVWLLNGRDWFSSVAILIGAVCVGIFANRKPRQLPYALDSSGLSIGDKHYKYSDFKSFSVAKEGAFDSIVFMPMKKLALFITIYFDPADEERIIELLHKSLPREDHKPDAIEQLLRAVRF